MEGAKLIDRHLGLGVHRFECCQGDALGTHGWRREEDGDDDYVVVGKK